MLPFMGVLFALMILHYLLTEHRERIARRVPQGVLNPVGVVLLILQIIAAIAALVIVAIVGHAGAVAAWTA